MCKKLPLILLFIVFLSPSRRLCAQEAGREVSPELTQLWRGALPGIITAPPVAEGATVTLICEGGVLSAYSAGGRPLWNFSAGGRLTRFISRSPEGMIYICQAGGVFIALNQVGREIWRSPLGSPLQAPAIVGRDGRLLLFTASRILCLTASGTLLWRRNLEAAPAFPPRITGTGYFLGALQNGEIIEVSPFGRVRSLRLAETPVELLPLRDGGLLVFAGDGRADLLPPLGSQGPAYSFPPLESPPVAAAVRGQNAALLLSSGKAVLLSGGGAEAAPGPLWTREALQGSLGREDAGLLYDDRGIHVLGKTAVRVFTDDGRELRNVRLPRSAAAVPALSPEGILYSGASDWILYAYRLGEPSRETPPGRILYRDAYGTADPRLENREGYPYGFTEREISRALRDITQSLDSGSVGNAEWLYLGYLMELSVNAGRDAQAPRSRRRLEPYEPVLLTHRQAALELLGRLGSRETVPFLIAVYNEDPEPVIKAAAASAIGRIGADPGGAALRAFGNLIYGPVYYRNEQVLLATAAATGSLCRFSPSLADAGIRLLSALETRDRSQAVRRRASRELYTLRSYQ
ncbi:MAG: HEAT repeat domain-containing protein [Spirochaetaceae bacterium]|nr:HEAT repeat domain-containing protein [Spirochaetaceae bacterium]